MFSESHKRWFVSVLCAISGISGIGYLSRLVAGSLLTNSYLSLFLFGGLAFLLYHTLGDIAQIKDKKAQYRRIIFSFLTALFFAITLIFGYQLKAMGMTECGLKGKGLILVRSFLLSFSIFPFSNALFKWAEYIKSSSKDSSSTNKPVNSSKIFLFSWIIIFLCWIPVFLAYYPAVMGFDFHRQSQEAAKGFIWFNNYQPLAHTLIIWVVFQIGNALGSLQTGMAFYSVFQMLVFSAAGAYTTRVIYRLAQKKWPAVLFTLYFALFPYNSILAVGVTKDVLFSALFLFFVSIFVERTCLANERKQKALDISWVIVGILMILYRNNALYAVAVFMIFYFFMVDRKQRMRIIVMALCLVIGGKGALEGIQIGLGTSGRGSKVEMFSVPIQQFARVGYYHGDSLDKETHDLINTYIPAEFWDNYYAPISDSVKALVGFYVFNDTWKDHYGDMLSAWVKVGLKYPNEYIDAFLLLTSGYWFIDDVTWAEVLGFGVEERMGALHTYNSTISESIPEGIEHESKFPWLETKLEEIISGNSFYNWPILSNLFKPAFYCWILLLTTILSIYNQDKKKLLLCLFPLIYLATMFLGPVVQVRYALPIMIVVPMLLAAFVRQDTE